MYLGTSPGCALNPSAPSGHEFSTSLAYSAATSLVWPVTLAHHLVHLGNVTPRTRLLLNAEASSNQLLLFAGWVVLRTLIVAWKSRHSRVVLLGLASCRALSKAAGSAD